MAVQTLTLLAPQSRQGTFTSNGVQAPSTIVGVKFILNLQLADKLATGLTATLHVEHSVTGNSNWLPVVGFGWTSYGPAGYRDNPDPFISFNPQVFPNEFYRVIVGLPQALVAGASIEITT